MATKKRSEERVTRETLKQLALAHYQTMKARDGQAGNPATTQIVIEMFDKQLRELEVQVMRDLKAWLGLEVGDGP